MEPPEDDPSQESQNYEFTISNVLVEGLAPNSDEIKFSIGPYQILDNIGKGGMGEVFLAYDTICGRRIALKRIREDLLDFNQINSRFLKEAHVTSQLTHPSIIPIYSIHKQGSMIYYTMPYVKGETLKEILRKTRRQERKGEKLDHIGGSIPALIRIFINICQAIAYAHSKKVLHRDLKPENIIIGQFGEVLILDWGLAKLMREEQEEEEELNIEEPKKGKMTLSGITKIGKVVGTVSYMAPERALGNAATYQTDIYSLGVILYQILTLRFPFRRGSLDEFRKNMTQEELADPIEIAPYRDIPNLLAEIAKKCLDPITINRYESVEELIRDLENYIEGRAEWFHIAKLNPLNKDDWEFQEHVYLPEHVAITRSTEASDWMNLMISKNSFSDNIKLVADVKIGSSGNGLGFLLSIPEAAERKHLNDGYCLWIGSDKNKSTKLMRSTVEVMHTPEITLRRNEWNHIVIDKVDNILHFYLNGSLQFSYISHLPFVGTHVGLISRDFDYEIKDLNIYIGGQNVMVKCLAVPDAFLAHKDYKTALSEYRRIGYSFPGRAEGREALFRAGITLLEQGKNCRNAIEAEIYYSQALEEFEKLYKTPGAPLEYLGKALVYQALHEYDEEIKCFELGCRRYLNHPLLSILQEQIVYRMHENSRISRTGTYQFILLKVRLLQGVNLGKHSKKLFQSLQNHWEPLPFFEELSGVGHSKDLKMLQFAIKLSFWLGKPYALEEIIDEAMKFKILSYQVSFNALFALIKLGLTEQVERKLKEIISIKPPTHKGIAALKDLRFVIDAEKALDKERINKYVSSLPDLTFSSERALLHVMELAISRQNYDIVHSIYAAVCTKSITASNAIYFDIYKIWACFLENNWEDGSKILLAHPIEEISQEISPLYSLYGCWLMVSEGKELANIHFAGLLETTYPRTWTLLGHFISGKIDEHSLWLHRAFLWEKRQLYKYMHLYYSCAGAPEIAQKYRQLEQEQYLSST